MSPNISYSVVLVTFKLSFWKIKVRYTIYLALGRVFIKGGCLYEGEKEDSPLKDVCPEKKLTNHSARKTVVKKLKSSGIPKCEILKMPVIIFIDISSNQVLGSTGQNVRLP